jgi:hypothetical protein
LDFFFEVELEVLLFCSWRDLIELVHLNLSQYFSSAEVVETID